MQQANIRHGDFELALEGRVLVAKLKGSWNAEAALAFEEAFKQTAQPLCEGNWGHLVYLDDWDLGVPEMMPIVERLVVWCIDNGLKRSAQVYCRSMLKKYQLDLMVVDRLGDFERRVFDDRDAAKDWLRSEGYAFD
jgi:hypothetical protein